MTTAELENGFHRLEIKVDVLVSCLTRIDTLPILGPMRNFEDYQKTLNQALEKADL